MIKHIRPLACALLLTTPALADETGTAADHEALRALKEKVTAAVNSRDYAAAQKLLHQPFMATVITQDSFTDFTALKAFFESLYTRDFARMKDISISAEADELSQIYDGPFAVTRGSTKERYDLVDGRSFDIKGRWTAVSMKENGEWKVLAVHTGANFLDNPILTAAEKSATWLGLGGSGIGLVVGFTLGWFVKRGRAKMSGA